MIAAESSNRKQIRERLRGPFINKLRTAAGRKWVTRIHQLFQPRHDRGSLEGRTMTAKPIYGPAGRACYSSIPQRLLFRRRQIVPESGHQFVAGPGSTAQGGDHVQQKLAATTPDRVHHLSGQKERSLPSGMISVERIADCAPAQTTLYLTLRCTVDFRNICVRVDATASMSARP